MSRRFILDGRALGRSARSRVADCAWRAGDRPGGRGDAVERRTRRRRCSSTRRRRRSVSVPHLAMVHGAIYDAVNAIDGGHEGYLLTSRVATPSDSKDAAAATAAHRVLLNIVPAQQAVLDAQYAASLAGDPGRLGEDARDRSRRGGGGGDDRGPDRRRPLRAYRFPVGTGPGRVAAGPAGVRQRPERVAEGREAVPDRERHAVPSRRPAPARRARSTRGSSTR